jgi:hypothetical protein
MTMTITLNLRPEVEEQVRSQAEARGMSTESYLAWFIENQILPARRPRPTLEEFEADLDAMAEGTDNIPVLPPEALTREAIYGDHD